MLGWPNRCKLTLHAFLWEFSYKGLKLAQLLGHFGAFLARQTGRAEPRRPPPRRYDEEVFARLDEFAEDAEAGPAAVHLSPGR